MLASLTFFIDTALINNGTPPFYNEAKLSSDDIVCISDLILQSDVDMTKCPGDNVRTAIIIMTSYNTE